MADCKYCQDEICVNACPKCGVKMDMEEDTYEREEKAPL